MALMGEIYPLQLLVASLAGWMNRRQGEVLEYLIEENRVLKGAAQGEGAPVERRSAATPGGKGEADWAAAPMAGRDHRDA